MQGYWNRPEETKVRLIEIDGMKWLRTGDLVRMDEEGYFHFFDRKRDLIKHKGYAVFARHVEEVLYNHPQIKAAGVVGVPDPKVGAIIKRMWCSKPRPEAKFRKKTSSPIARRTWPITRSRKSLNSEVNCPRQTWEKYPAANSEKKARRSDMAESLLEIRSLSKSFGGLHATNNISFSMGRHEMVGLIGPNGAGKTTASA